MAISRISQNAAGNAGNTFLLAEVALKSILDDAYKRRTCGFVAMPDLTEESLKTIEGYRRGELGAASATANTPFPSLTIERPSLFKVTEGSHKWVDSDTQYGKPREVKIDTIKKLKGQLEFTAQDMLFNIANMSGVVTSSIEGMKKSILKPGNFTNKYLIPMSTRVAVASDKSFYEDIVEKIPIAIDKSSSGFDFEEFADAQTYLNAQSLEGLSYRVAMSAHHWGILAKKTYKSNPQFFEPSEVRMARNNNPIFYRDNVHGLQYFVTENIPTYDTGKHALASGRNSTDSTHADFGAPIVTNGFNATNKTISVAANNFAATSGVVLKKGQLIRVYKASTDTSSDHPRVKNPTMVSGEYVATDVMTFNSFVVKEDVNGASSGNLTIKLETDEDFSGYTSTYGDIGDSYTRLPKAGDRVIGVGSSDSKHPQSVVFVQGAAAVVNPMYDADGGTDFETIRVSDAQGTFGFVWDWRKEFIDRKAQSIIRLFQMQELVERFYCVRIIGQAFS